MEIVLRAVIIFFFLWTITRVVGRSTLGELSTFELILFITMGDLVQQAVTQQDYSMTAAMLAVGTFALLTIILSWINVRSRRARRVIHGRPVVIFHSGEPCDAMRHERVSFADFFAAARQQGIEHLEDVRLAVLEANGQISFFAQDAAEDGAPPQPPGG